ncbi:10373_t:CDS:2 [Cetraspora pellucida]|uniref:10373_t:CDS:1 n=1 Tax=Cetraspora pellucida TaxID=1433469 RepID=A0A9N9JX68_9GLOM|nr:10373_t:CDS:2 [Cetraspora pellucida]
MSLTMLLPPSATYNSADELLQSVQSFANSQGCALVKKRTRKNHCGKLKNMLLHCDWGGTYSTEAQHRQTSSRLIDCPFELYASLCDGLWYLEVHNLEHNHERSINMLGHPISRRLTGQQLERVIEMTVSGSGPRKIVSALRQNDKLALVTSRDIYNACGQLHQQNLAGHTSIQALIDELSEGDFIYKCKYDNNGSITHLFFAHNKSIALTREYSSVLLMDCTYKTNKFKMPLLNIVGITSFYTTFYSCFIFIKDKEEKDYCWALNNVASLFNGLQFSKETDENSEWNLFLSKWNEIVKSKTEDEFNLNWQNFQTTYINKPQISQKKQFVEAWTNAFLHLGTTVTLRIEINNQKREIDAMTASECICFLAFVHNNPFYINIRGMVSTFTLKKVSEQYQKAIATTTKKPLSSCTRSFLSTMGLPCAHIIQNFMSNRNLTLDDIHKHCWIQNRMPLPSVKNEDALETILQNLQTTRESLNNMINTPVIVLKNPQIIHTRGHPTGSSNH